MASNGLVEAQEALRWFRSFEECILHDIRWRHLGSEIDLVFNYIWGADGLCRKRVLEEPQLVAVRCFGVHELLLSNGLSHQMLDEPELLTWGLSEVAGVRLEPRSVDEREAVQVAAVWEGDTRSLRVVTARLEIIEVR